MSARRFNTPGELAPANFLPVPVRLRSRGSEIEFGQQLLDALSASKFTLVVGQAGAGKTSLTASIAARDIRNKQNVLFLQLGLWQSSERLDDVLRRVGAESWQDDVTNYDLIVLDAVDESRAQSLDDAFDQILGLAQRLGARTRLIVTCRAGGVPRWVFQDFDEVVDVLPLPFDVVRRAVGKLLPEYEKLGSLDSTDIIDVCRNPMMLSLTSFIGGTEDGRARLQRVRSKSQLIMLYSDLLIERDVAARRLGGGFSRFVSAGLAKVLLAKLAAYLLDDAAAASVNDADLELACSRWLNSEDLAAFFGRTTASPTPAALASAIKTLPLVTVLVSDVLPTEIKFAHLNFRDVIGASHYVSSQSPTVSLPVASDQWFRIVIQAGLADRPGTVSEPVIDYGTETRDQEYFRLAAHCVLERWDERGERVDDLVLRVLDAFKNWGKPFDYELVRAARALSARFSSNCPQRLSDDLAYFGNKYAPVPVKIVETDSPHRLLGYATSTDRQLRSDSIYSFSYYVQTGQLDADSVITLLWRLIQTTVDAQELELSVAALKSLGEAAPAAVKPYTLGMISEIGRVSTISWRATAFLLNALAYVGESSAMPIVGEMLLDGGNEYRDSASWSLLILARRHLTEGPSVRNLVVSLYRAALVGPRNVSADIYAVGNVLYSIGELKLVELQFAVFEACRRAEAYVREDAVFALGLLEDPAGSDMITLLLGDVDPGVRLKAVEAAGAVRTALTQARLEEIATSDAELPYIRMMANRSLERYLRDATLNTTVADVLNTRRRRDARTSIIGPVDANTRDILRSAIEQAVAAHGHPRDFKERAVGGGTEFIVSNKILSSVEKLS